MHCALLQTEELQVVVGDAERDGAGGRQYCGIWSLTSKHRVFNAFGNSFAGLIPGEIRGKAPRLEVVDKHTVVLQRDADGRYPVSARALYRVVEPHAIDHVLSCTDLADVRAEGCSFREYTWCSYTNSPEDPRLHFLSGGTWFRYISPRHGYGANIAPAGVPEADLEAWPPRTISPYGDPTPFHWDRIRERFDLPFYYGRLGDMVLIFMFQRPDGLRFYCSPSGGGVSLLPGRTCPAWDFEWVVPGSAYAVGRAYEFRLRTVYKPFVSDEDVLAEFRRYESESKREGRT